MPQMQNAELTYQNSLLTQQQNDLDDVVQVTVSSGTVSVLPNDNSSTTLGDSLRSLMNVFPWLKEAAEENKDSLNTVISSTTNADLTLSPSVEVVLPNDRMTGRQPLRHQPVLVLNMEIRIITAFHLLFPQNTLSI